MAKVKEMPGLQIVDGFKGKLDFYYYMGIPCVRKWPRSQGNSQTPASVAQWPMFTYVQQIWQSVSPYVQDAWANLADNAGLHKRDWFMRGYYGKLYRYPSDPQP